jgi:hypothetical protein
MAAAHVSGALALLLAQGLGPDDAVERLLATAVPCADCGRGRLDAAAAVGAHAAAPVLRAAAGSGTPGKARIVGTPHHPASAAPAAPRRAPAPVVVPVDSPPPGPAASPAGAVSGPPPPSRPSLPVSSDRSIGGERAAVPIDHAVAGAAAAALVAVVVALVIVVPGVEEASRRRWRGT